MTSGDRASLRAAPDGPDARANASLEILERDNDPVAWRLVVRNAADHPLNYEGLLPEPGEGGYRFSRRVRREDGRWIWRTRIPANGTASIEWAPVID